MAESDRYVAAMQSAGQPHDSLVVDGTHDWTFFRNKTPACLNWLVGP